MVRVFDKVFQGFLYGLEMPGAVVRCLYTFVSDPFTFSFVGWLLFGRGWCSGCPFLSCVLIGRSCIVCSSEGVFTRRSVSSG